MILERSIWKARPPVPNWGQGQKPIDGPVKFVNLCHSAAEIRLFKTDTAHLQMIQNYHMDTRGYSDTAYNQFASNTGGRYEGRGWGVQGGGVGHPEDETSYTICALGNFEIDEPTDALIGALVFIIRDGIDNGAIDPDFKLRGDHEINVTACPGNKLIPKIPEIEALAKAPRGPAVVAVAEAYGDQYTVKAGDTLWRISQSSGVSQYDIRDYNSLGADAVLSVGQVLRLKPLAEEIADVAPPVRIVISPIAAAAANARKLADDLEALI